MASDGPTIEDVTALTCAATPQFAFQIRARVRALIGDLPADDPVRRYGEQQAEMLARLGYSSSIAAEGPLASAGRIGWETIRSHRPARTDAV
jgi:hypothetical protein